VYQWIAPEFIILSSNIIEQPSFIIPEGLKAGTKLTFQLIISDNIADAVDSIDINILNTTPSVVIERDLIFALGDRLSRVYWNSSDVNDDPLSYAWEVLSAPSDSVAIMGDSLTLNPIFTPDQLVR